MALLRRLLSSGGRPAGALALVLVIGAVLAWPDGPARSLRLTLFDAYQTLAPRTPETSPAIIVAIDEASLAAIGQWPWRRSVLADLIGIILDARPAAVGIDILMPEPDRTSPAAWARDQPGLPSDLAERLASLPSNDALLAAALSRGPVALGVAGLDSAAGRPGPFAPVRSFGGDTLPHLIRYASALRSLPVIDRAVPGHGLLSVETDKDGVVRRMPLLAAVGAAAAPGLGVELLRLAAGAPDIAATVSAAGIEKLGIGPLVLPTAPDGTVWVRFGRHEPGRFVSAADVISGRVGADLLADRIVLVGVTGIGLLDQPLTPLGERVPGIEIHAQLLENLLDGTPLSRPRHAWIGELVLLIAIGAGLIAAIPSVRPGAAALVGVGILACLASLGFGAFVWAHALIDIATPAAGSGIVFVTMLGLTLNEVSRQRRALAATLERERLAAARLAGELEAARRIQIGILPRPESLPHDPRLQIAALMEPARMVGGDLYDFFHVDADRLFVAVGDVSGKGIPASLFMAQTKALLKSVALRHGRSLDRIADEANKEIARDNNEMLFVTLCAVMLDLKTGAIAWCNAGHDAPWSLRQGEAPRRLETPGGPPFCVLEDFPYPVETYQLEKGEILLLTTDGISEAQDSSKALYGKDRLAAALATLPPDATAAQVVTTVRDNVAAFVGDSEPADDLSLVALRWIG